MKKTIVAILAVFVSWMILDFIIHSVLLSGAYRETASLWRPMAEMKMVLLYSTVLLSAIVFVLIYAKFFAMKGVAAGLGYGILFGIGTGISMGYGSYAVMPIPYKMAFIWCWGTVVEATVAGLLVGLIIREPE